MSLISRSLPSRVTIRVKAKSGEAPMSLTAVHLPAGSVTLRGVKHEVGPFILTEPVQRGHVQNWAQCRGDQPFVRFAMGTMRDRQQKGVLQVAQMGAHPDDMENVVTAAPASISSVVVGRAPLDVLTRYQNLKGDPESVMAGLSFFEQVALADFLTSHSVPDEPGYSLGAIGQLTSVQLVYALVNYPELFEDDQNRQGLPEAPVYWTRDLVNLAQLNRPPATRLNAWRRWVGLPSVGEARFREGISYGDDRYRLSAHNPNILTRFAITTTP